MPRILTTHKRHPGGNELLYFDSPKMRKVIVRMHLGEATCDFDFTSRPRFEFYSTKGQVLWVSALVPVNFMGKCYHTSINHSAKATKYPEGDGTWRPGGGNGEVSGKRGWA